jgi:hypothetical protein
METFGDWADRWVSTIAGLTPKTGESYESILRRHLLPRFDDTPVNRIDHPAVVALMAELTSTGAGTVRNVRDVLRLVLELARRSGAIKVNPVEGAKAPKKTPAEMVFLNAHQIMTLGEELANPPINRGGGEHLRPDIRSVGFSCDLPASLVYGRARSSRSERSRLISSMVASMFWPQRRRRTGSSSSDPQRPTNVARFRYRQHL